MMPIQFTCTGCDKKLKVKDDAGGKRIRCPECQAVLTVPEPDRPAAAGDDDFLSGLSEAVKQEKKRPRAPVEEEDDYEDDAPPEPKRRTRKTSSKKKSSSSDGGGGVWKVIGGVFVGLLIVVGIIGKFAKVARVGGFLNQNVTWQNFQHPKGGASIDMPGRATYDTKSTSDPNAPVYTVATRNFSCSLTTAELPALATAAIASNPQALDMLFTEMKNGMLGMKSGAQLISETPLQLGGTRGMELRIQIGSAVNLSRVYITSTHLCAAEIVFPSNREPTTERDRYFGSFRLAGVAAGGANPVPNMAMPNMAPPGMSADAAPGSFPQPAGAHSSSAGPPQ